MFPSIRTLLRKGSGSRRRAVVLTWPVLALLLVLPLWWGTLGLPGEVPAGEEGETELDRLRRETRTLRLETELASRVGPYLVADLQEKTLSLKLEGVILREFPVLDMFVRTRRSAGRPGGWPLPMDTIWSGGRLLPEVQRRREVIYSDSVTPPDPSGTVATIPPTPEEAVPTPPSFRVRFLEKRSLAVTTRPRALPEEGEDGGGPSPWSRMTHWVRGKPWRRDLVRLDVTMAEEEAGALYRALPPGIPMLVVGPGPKTGPGAPGA